MVAMKILIPIVVSEKIYEPVNVTANANPGLTQESASFCASLREIELFLYNATAFFTPNGYPPISPVRSPWRQFSDNLKNLRIGIAAKRNIISGISISFIIREIISIGNKEGIIADAHRDNELFIADFIISVLKINKIKTTKIIKNADLPILSFSKSFLSIFIIYVYDSQYYKMIRLHSYLREDKLMKLDRIINKIGAGTDFLSFQSFYFEMNSEEEICIHGCKDISEYDDCKITVKTDKFLINVIGMKLKVEKFSVNFTCICGDISGIEFCKIR